MSERTRSDGGAVRVEPVRVITDARGLVVEPLEPDGFAAQRNAHLVLTEPGHVRGNHYHERGTEVIVVLGPGLVRLREDGVDRDVLVPPGEATRFVIPPGVPHAFRAPGPGPMVLIGFNTEVHDPARPDTVRVALLEA